MKTASQKTTLKLAWWS